MSTDARLALSLFLSKYRKQRILGQISDAQGKLHAITIQAIKDKSLDEQDPRLIYQINFGGRFIKSRVVRPAETLRRYKISRKEGDRWVNEWADLEACDVLLARV